MEELNELLLQRREKVQTFRDAGINPFANNFVPSHQTSDVAELHIDDDAESLQDYQESYAIAGRVMARRDFGKAAFIQLQDGVGRLQVYVEIGRAHV